MAYEVFSNSKPSIFQIVLFWGYSGLVILNVHFQWSILLVYIIFNTPQSIIEDNNIIHNNIGFRVGRIRVRDISIGEGLMYNSLSCACMYIYLTHSSGFHYDSRLRSGVVQFYGSMFGRLTPSCVPQGVSGRATYLPPPY